MITYYVMEYDTRMSYDSTLILYYRMNNGVLEEWYGWNKIPRFYKSPYENIEELVHLGARIIFKGNKKEFEKYKLGLELIK